ncbi:glycosyltransferase [Cellulomonas sp. Marseille-Q8402]
MSARLRVLVIAPLRFPIRQPHAGGLESAVWNEVRTLRARGHDVTLIAVEGSEFLDAGPAAFAMPTLAWPDGARSSDSRYPPAYLERSVPALDRALDLVAATAHRYDVISNHCLHGLPLRRAGELGVPMLSTLHTPVDDDLVAADTACAGERSRFVAVSEHTRAEWARAGITSTVLPNGIDADAWPQGAGGAGLVWFGRLVPEKAPHLAIAAARALGRELTLAGRVGDQDYAERFVLPHLGDGVRHVGLLSQPALADLLGRSACALVTPAWAEPYGLVGPEALMCGTPVAGFAVGGVTEIARTATGMTTVPAGDVDALAAAAAGLIERSAREPGLRDRVRATARRHFSLDARVDALEELFAAMVAERHAQVGIGA